MCLHVSRQLPRLRLLLSVFGLRIHSADGLYDAGYSCCVGTGRSSGAGDSGLGSEHSGRRSLGAGSDTLQLLGKCRPQAARCDHPFNSPERHGHPFPRERESIRRHVSKSLTHSYTALSIFLRSAFDRQVECVISLCSCPFHRPRVQHEYLVAGCIGCDAVRSPSTFVYAR